MYFPALKNSLQYIEEKKFYDVAILYLSVLGYKDLCIVDGKGDGGRDVTCSREDLRIQLSVQGKWEAKLNKEAGNTKTASKRHFLYVTNKIISPDAESAFLQDAYDYAGEVELSIHDLRRICTALARPGVINRAYAQVGMIVPEVLTATPNEIATSTMLLFSDEARELKDEIFSANLRSEIYKSKNADENILIGKIAQKMPGENVEKATRAALARLKAKGRVVSAAGKLSLSPSEAQIMAAAETEFLNAKSQDISMLITETQLPHAEVDNLLTLAFGLLVRKRDLDGFGPEEEAIKQLLSKNNLSRSKGKVFAALARCKTVGIRQYGEALAKITETNTFDIYRALGKRSDLQMVLDSSVAMPVLFGLEFGAANSRYGIAALALRDLCAAHNIKMVIPRKYLNEMAAHGRQALQRLDSVYALSDELRPYFRASGNAYLSHFFHIYDAQETAGGSLTLDVFLRHFGIVPEYSLHRTENIINSLLENHSIEVISDANYDQEVFESIAREKRSDPYILIQHDASVCTMLKNDSTHGYIFATWDKVLIDIVRDLARVLADSPTRIIDFLSMAKGQHFEAEQSFDLLSSLLYIDEKITQRVAEKLDHIKSVEQAYKLNSVISSARNSNGPSWILRPEDIESFVTQVEIMEPPGKPVTTINAPEIQTDQSPL